ncbi:hypothetical protein IMZ48_27275 [Candidatus Bathyarchaeota archaeon]|nr:hypothetical protein [Candidatus Bathyarchaeota archaeon]
MGDGEREGGLTCDKIGSVQVTHEPMTRAARRVILGMVASMQSVVHSHIAVIILFLPHLLEAGQEATGSWTYGKRQRAISFHLASWYFAGSWKPAITSWSPIMTRIIP